MYTEIAMPKQPNAYPFRMPSDLRDSLEKSAKVHERSLNAEMVYGLRLYLASLTAEASAPADTYQASGPAHPPAHPPTDPTGPAEPGG